jgi:hypothetical protein
MAVCVAAGFALGAFGQQGGAEGGQPARPPAFGGRFGFQPPAGTAGETALSVLTNATVAAALELSPEQVKAVHAELTADLARDIVTADLVARTVAAVLADPAVAGKLKLTEKQVAAARAKLTGELIRRAYTAPQIGELARGLTSGLRGGRGMAQEVFQRIDKDGDGNISQEEREAARDAFRRWAGPGGELPERLKRFDEDGDGRLSDAEREKARAAFGPGQRDGRGPDRRPRDEQNRPLEGTGLQTL